jgi:hypothetical protein
LAADGFRTVIDGGKRECLALMPDTTIPAPSVAR